MLNVTAYSANPRHDWLLRHKRSTFDSQTILPVEALDTQRRDQYSTTTLQDERREALVCSEMWSILNNNAARQVSERAGLLGDASDTRYGILNESSWCSFGPVEEGERNGRIRLKLTCIKPQRNQILILNNVARHAGRSADQIHSILSRNWRRDWCLTLNNNIASRTSAGRIYDRRHY